VADVRSIPHFIIGEGIVKRLKKACFGLLSVFVNGDREFLLSIHRQTQEQISKPHTQSSSLRYGKLKPFLLSQNHHVLEAVFGKDTIIVWIVFQVFTRSERCFVEVL